MEAMREDECMLAVSQLQRLYIMALDLGDTEWCEELKQKIAERKQDANETYERAIEHIRKRQGRSKGKGA